MSTAGNPLFGSWTPPGTSGNDPSQNPFASISNPERQTTLPNSDIGSLNRQIGRANLAGQLQRDQLIPLFAQQMGGYAGPAGDFFKQLLNLGSPFYQRKQQQTFEQGSKASQDAAGQARQQIAQTGAGYTPSGVSAAAFGGMGQAEAGNQEEAFLNNLFQNEQLQSLGASGLTQLAGLFNPSQLFGNAPSGPLQPSWTEKFAQVFSSVFPKGFSK